MKLKSITFLTLLTLAVSTSGCASATAGIAVSNIPLENRNYEVLGPAEAHAGWWAFDAGIIAAPFKKPPIDDVMRDLIAQQDGGQALINIRYSNDRIIILFLTLYRFHVRADVVRIVEKPQGNRR